MFRSHLSEVDLIEYADGELTGARRSRAHDHLRHCEACAETLEALQSSSRAVQAIPAPAAPSDLRRRIVTRIADEHAAPSISCRKALALIQQSLDMPLPAFSDGMLQLHLDACDACRQEYRALSAAAAAVRSLPPAPAPAWIRQAALASRSARPAPVSWGVRLRPAMAAAAMAAGALVVLLSRSGPSPLPVIAKKPAIASVTQAKAQPVVPTLPQAALSRREQPVEAPLAVALQPAPEVREHPKAPPVYRMRLAAVPVVEVETASRPARAHTPQYGKQLMVHYVAPEVTPARTEEAPSPFRALQAVVQTASARTPQDAMRRAADLWGTMAAESKAARVPVDLASRVGDASAVSSTAQPKPGPDATPADTQPAPSNSAAGEPLSPLTA